MGRHLQRVQHLTPQYLTKLKQWIPTRTHAHRTLGLAHQMTYHDFCRVLRCEDATEKECKLIEHALYNYGKQHNFDGWQDLEPSDVEDYVS